MSTQQKTEQVTPVEDCPDWSICRHCGGMIAWNESEGCYGHVITSCANGKMRAEPIEWTGANDPTKPPLTTPQKHPVSIIPLPRTRISRLPESARNMEVGSYIDTDDTKTALCIISYGRYRGWKMVRRTENGTLRVWRIS